MSFLVKTNRGRELIINDDEPLPFFDITTMSSNECHVDKCEGLPVVVNKPYLPNSSIESVSDIKMTFDAGWILAHIYSRGFFEKDYGYICFFNNDISDRFELIVKSIFDDLEINDVNRLIGLDAPEGRWKTIKIKSNKLLEFIHKTGILPRKSIGNNLINTSIQFREGFISGLFDSSGRVIKIKRKDSDSFFYNIVLFEAHQRNLYDLFLVADSIDLNVRMFRRVRRCSSINVIYIDPLDLFRRKDLFSRITYRKNIERIQNIDVSRLVNRYDLVPYTKSLHKKILKLNKSIAHPFSNAKKTFRIFRSTAIDHANIIVNNKTKNKSLLKWANIVMNNNIKFEFYTKPVKI
jgi:hypothetical protein